VEFVVDEQENHVHFCSPERSSLDECETRNGEAKYGRKPNIELELANRKGGQCKRATKETDNSPNKPSPRTHATSQTVETFLSGLLLDPVSYRLGRKEHSAGKKWKVPEVESTKTSKTSG